MNLKELFDNKDAIDETYRIQFNRVLAMGLDKESTDEMLKRIETLYDLNIHNLKMMTQEQSKDS